MSDLVKAHYQMTESLNLITHALLKQCLRTLLREHVGKDKNEVEFQLEETTLKLKQPLIVELSHHTDDWHTQAFMIQKITLRYSEDGQAFFYARNEEVYSLFEIEMSWNEEEQSYDLEFHRYGTYGKQYFVSEYSRTKSIEEHA